MEVETTKYAKYSKKGLHVGNLESTEHTKNVEKGLPGESLCLFCLFVPPSSPLCDRTANTTS